MRIKKGPAVLIIVLAVALVAGIWFIFEGSDGSSDSDESSENFSLEFTDEDVAAYEKLDFSSAAATSELISGTNSKTVFYAKNIVDGDFATAWQEDAKDGGIDESATLYFDNAKEIYFLKIYPGYLTSEGGFNATSHPTKLDVGLSNGGSYTIEFPTYDYYTARRGFVLKLDKPTLTEYIKLTILDTVDGVEYTDTAISEIEVFSKNPGIQWNLSGDGILTIGGTGALLSYDNFNATLPSPWYSQRTSVKTIVIQPGVTGIGFEAFYGCSNVVSVQIPDTVTHIDAFAFEQCSSLKKVEFPDSVTFLGKGAFQHCDSLVSATLPSGLTEIPQKLFSNCKSLKTVTIPSTVSKIGTWAFDSCSALEEVRFQGTSAQWKEMRIGSKNDVLTEVSVMTSDTND